MTVAKRCIPPPPANPVPVYLGPAPNTSLGLLRSLGRLPLLFQDRGSHRTVTSPHEENCSDSQPVLSPPFLAPNSPLSLPHVASRLPTASHSPGLPHPRIIFPSIFASQWQPNGMLRVPRVPQAGEPSGLAWLLSLPPQGIFSLPLYWTTVLALAFAAMARSLDPPLERPPDTAIDVVLGSAPDGTLEPAQGRTLWLVLWLVLGPARGPVLRLVLGSAQGPDLGLVLGPALGPVLGLVLGPARGLVPWLVLRSVLCLVLWLVLGWALGPVLYLVLGSVLCLVLRLVLGSPPDRVLEQALDRTAVPVPAKARGAAEELAPAAAAAASAVATAAAAPETPRAARQPEAGQCPGPRQLRGPWPHTASGPGSGRP